MLLSSLHILLAYYGLSRLDHGAGFSLLIRLVLYSRVLGAGSVGRDGGRVSLQGLLDIIKVELAERALVALLALVSLVATLTVVLLVNDPLALAVVERLYLVVGYRELLNRAAA